jgi:enoyl-CoA hydratase/carnithine racemase
MSATFDEYRNHFENVALERDPCGILEMRLHTDNGPFVWDGEPTQTEVADAIAAISADSDNRVLILTGTGDLFWSQHPSHRHGGPLYWERARARTFRWVFGLLDFPGPIISCINGPAYSHSEFPLLADVVLAADDAFITDRVHFCGDIAPGDSVGLIIPYIMGFNRGRYFHFTGQQLSAQEMFDNGLVSEVMPREQLLPRARAIAADMATRHPLVLSYSRRILVAPLRRMLADHLGEGFALEAIARIATGTDERP